MKDDRHALPALSVLLLFCFVDVCRSAHVGHGGPAQDHIPRLRHYLLHRCAGKLPSVRKWLWVQFLLSRRRRQGRIWNQILCCTVTGYTLCCAAVVVVLCTLTRRCLAVQFSRSFAVPRTSVFCNQMCIVQKRGFSFCGRGLFSTCQPSC